MRRSGRTGASRGAGSYSYEISVHSVQNSVQQSAVPSERASGACADELRPSTESSEPLESDPRRALSRRPSASSVNSTSTSSSSGGADSGSCGGPIGCACGAGCTELFGNGNAAGDRGTMRGGSGGGGGMVRWGSGGGGSSFWGWASGAGASFVAGADPASGAGGGVSNTAIGPVTGAGVLVEARRVGN